ncbi:11536_t:CDS:1, partial [Racocetra fulgida]
NLCREIVSNLLGKPSEIRKPDFLKTNKYPKRLELDIYYPQYRFAIEVQGIQHKYQTDFFYK